MGERLVERLAAMGLTQAELARRVGISAPSINHLVKQGATGSKHLHRIAAVLETTPAYLTGESEDPVASALPAASPEAVAEQLDLVAVEEITLEFGMGATVLHDEHESIRRWVPRDWMTHFSKSPPHLLRFARGRGDSMYPTILDGDLVLIDVGQTRITVQDEIWAVGFGDLGGLKRLRSMGGGMIKVMSDNPHVSDETFHMDELRIIGRVCGNLRKM